MAQLIIDIVTTSGTDTYTSNLKTKYSAYQLGIYLVKFTNANTTASTLNIDGLGVKNIVKPDGSALSGGEFTAGSTYILVYDGTNFIAESGATSTTGNNFANADLIFNATRTHDLAGFILNIQDSTAPGNTFSLRLDDAGSGYLALAATDSSGAFFDFQVNTGTMSYSLDDGTGRTGLIEVNNGYSSIQVSDSIGSFPGSGGFIAHGRKLQLIGEATFKSIGATDDSILDADNRWYPYVVSGVLKGRYRGVGIGSIADVTWDKTKIEPGTNGQFMKTSAGASTWDNIVVADVSGAIGGSGTTNYVAKFTASGTIGNSLLQDDGSGIGINNAPQSNYKVYINSDKIVGLQAVNNAASGTNNFGLAGSATNANSASNIGVFGSALLSTGGTNLGVRGQAASQAVTSSTSIVAAGSNIGGFFQANESSGTAYGLVATADATSNQASATFIGALIRADNAGTKYAVQLVDGTEGTGKFLKSITSDGKANWASLTYADLASMTSAQLASIISDETGTGFLVFSTSPSLTTPSLGVATATSINGNVFSGAIAATWSLSNNKTFSVSNSLALAGTDGTTMTFPTTSDTVAGLAASQTFTNKRINPRVSSSTSSSAPTPNANTDDSFHLTALAVGATFGAPTGTPASGQRLLIRIKDNGGAQTLAFNAIYRAVGVTLPTTTVAGKILYMGCIWNAGEAKWDVVALSQEA